MNMAMIRSMIIFSVFRCNQAFTASIRHLGKSFNPNRIYGYHFLTTESKCASGVNLTYENLADTFAAAYLDSETDGIIKLAPYILGRFSGEELVSASLQATKNNKGQAAGILNAIIGSCAFSKQNDHAAPLAWELYSTWEVLADELQLFPDTVTFCNAFSAMHNVSKIQTEDKEFYNSCAAQILESARKFSKKLAGSKRRKLLNTLSRRQTKDSYASDQLTALKKFSDEIEVLFENDDIVAINKPAGMVIYHMKTTTDGKITRKKRKNINNAENVGDSPFDFSLVDILQELGVPLSTLNVDALGVVHRIDRGTSGIVVFAKNDESHCRLVTAFFTRAARKEYIAAVPWKSNIDGSDEISPIGHINEKVGGRPAVSTYELLKSFPNIAYQLRVKTMSGRKHQVRVHCASLGRPILLDPLYGNLMECGVIHDRITNSGTSYENKFFLHASSLRIDEFDLDVTVDTPKWWNDILKDV